MKRVVVFAGPPCSGKSTYGEHFAAALAAPHFEMDAIRARILPHAAHTRADREVAYRVMHMMAEAALALGHGCIVNASYSHQADREALGRIGAPVFLIECHVTADAAVERSAGRRGSHPGHDLTEARVRELVAAYPFSGLGLAVDSSEPLPACVSAIAAYLAADVAIGAGAWASAV